MPGMMPKTNTNRGKIQNADKGIRNSNNQFTPSSQPSNQPTGKPGQVIGTLIPFTGNGAGALDALRRKKVSLVDMYFLIHLRSKLWSIFKFPKLDRGRDNPNVSITAGGPGSSTGLCCGVTTPINTDNGKPYFRIATEDWTSSGGSSRMQLLCSNKPTGEEHAMSCGGNPNLLPASLGTEKSYDKKLYLGFLKLLLHISNVNTLKTT
jgi:hypothetical protein